MRTATTRISLAACIGAALVLLPLAGGCDRDVSKSKVTTEKTTTTPDGVKKTTETTEKKVEVERKNP
ncbi:MAG: hypothetical protein ACREJO_09865 [Phycisphaerales bacterium]